MKKAALSILTILLCILLKAQSTNAASGGNAFGTGGSAMYSVGQVVYTTNTGENGSAAQGVHDASNIYLQNISTYNPMAYFQTDLTLKTASLSIRCIKD